MESLSALKRQRLGHLASCAPALGPAAGEAEGRRSRRKRQRAQQGLDTEDTATSCSQGDDPRALCPLDAPCEYEVSLYIRWQSAEGGTRVNRLPLDAISSVDDLRGLFRRLILGAYEGAPLPDYLTSPDFYKFSPAEDFLALPGDIARTNFRLVVTLGGWEYGVADRELGVNPDPQRNLLVTVAEFESDVFELDGQECVMNLISYPTICVRRDFLDAAVRDLQRERSMGAGGCSEGCPPAQGAPMPASSTS